MGNHKRRRKHKKLLILIIFIVVEAIVIIWHQGLERVEEECYKPVGKLVDVNSHQVHMVQKGEGNLTIVFLTGSGTPCGYTDFYNLQDNLSKTAKTVTFDRAGFGWSEDTTIERTVDNLVIELEELLSYTGKSESFVIVAHSLASLEALRFAQQYPKQVKGIIFLDCGSPEYYKDYSETSAMALNRAEAFLRFTGWNRLVTGLVKLPFVGENLRYKGLPEELQKLDLSMYNRFLGNASNIDNIMLINENAETVLEHKKKLDIPLLVISSDQEEEWIEMQDQLCEWSTNSELVVLKNSSHYIHWSNQEEVLQLINIFMKDM